MLTFFFKDFLQFFGGFCKEVWCLKDSHNFVFYSNNKIRFISLKLWTKIEKSKREGQSLDFCPSLLPFKVRTQRNKSCLDKQDLKSKKQRTWMLGFTKTSTYVFCIMNLTFIYVLWVLVRDRTRKSLFCARTRTAFLEKECLVHKFCFKVTQLWRGALVH